MSSSEIHHFTHHFPHSKLRDLPSGKNIPSDGPRLFGKGIQRPHSFDLLAKFEGQTVLRLRGALWV
jgi:hypothetical protein